MADLHNKLAMRRKGISGARDSDNARPNMIERISSMIPPPPPPSSKSPIESGDSDDNGDEDEWN